MKSIRKYSCHIMIFVVVVCALSLFCYVQNSSPSSSTESFATAEPIKIGDEFKFKHQANSPGEEGDKFKINNKNKLYIIRDGKDEPMYEKMFNFEIDNNKITGTRTFEIKKA